MSGARVALRGVRHSYGTNTVLDGIDVTVEPGEFVALLGASGTGKSTLLRLIADLETVNEGDVEVTADGHDALIRVMFQEDRLLPWQRVLDNVQLGTHKRRDDALRLLDAVGLSDKTNSWPSDLSGGQRQRVAIARALLQRPDLLLLDEPFGALDAIIRTKAREDLQALQKQLGITIILVTHDIEEAIQLGDMIAVMDAGKLIQYASPADILTRPANAFVKELIGSGERPFRLLSLRSIREVIEPGPADGAPLSASISQRDALAEMLWSGRRALPVEDAAGAAIGRVTLDALTRQVLRPS